MSIRKTIKELTGITNPDLQELLGNTVALRQYQKGDVLLRIGETAQKLYLLKSGIVRC